MLALLSPSKTLECSVPIRGQYTQPEFITQAQALIAVLKKLSEKDIAKLMDISSKLAALNYQRYHEFTTPFTPHNARQALFMFQGDVYDGLDAASLTAAEVQRAQKHIRIVSGLYGLLRPLDLMQPYRLEMGTTLANRKGKNLYEFWGDSVTGAINAVLKETQDDVVVNLASNEYAKVVKPKILQARMITPSFKEYKNGKYQMLMLYVKQARGMMARFMVVNGLKEADGLKEFRQEGYQFNAELSAENEWVFTR